MTKDNNDSDDSEHHMGVDYNRLSIRPMSMSSRIALPNGIPSQALRVASGRQQAQDWQAVVTPREVLLSPLFWSGRTASNHQASSVKYVMWENGKRANYITQTVNPIALNPAGLGGRKNPSGLLRYLDLDILMALSYEYTRTGQPRITTSQRLLLHMMGYSNLDTAPFREFRASVQRMAATTIVTSDMGAPPDTMAPWRLVALNAISAGEKGRLGLLDAALSSEWAAATEAVWQVLDMRGYVHLCRTARENGLARVLYLFFGAIAKHSTGEFYCPLSWIHERFGDRRGGPVISGRYEYSNPLNRNSNLWRALSVLVDQKIIRLDEVVGNPEFPDKVILRGSFAAASSFPRIPDVEPDRQQVLIAIDKATGEIIHPETLDPIRRLGGNLPSDKKVDVDRESEQKNEELVERESTVIAKETVKISDGNIESKETRLLKILRPIIRVNRGVEEKAIKSGGWGEAEIVRLYLVALYQQSVGTVPKPGAWAAQILRDGWSADWEQQKLKNNIDIRTVREWASSPSGPLYNSDLPSSFNAPVHDQPLDPKLSEQGAVLFDTQKDDHAARGGTIEDRKKRSQQFAEKIRGIKAENV